MAARKLAFRRIRGLPVVAAMAAALLLLAAQARAASLDKSFGNNGRAATGFAFAGGQPEPGVPASWENAEVEVVAGPGGSTVVAGKHQIARFAASGKLDTGFGQSGRLTPAMLEGLNFEIADVAFDDQGRLLVFGTGEDATVTTHAFVYPTIGTYHPKYAVVARYTEAGALDPSFGGGDGVARTDLGLKSDLVFQEGPDVPQTAVSAGAVDGRDRPIVVATTLVWGGYAPRGQMERNAPVVARLSPTGDWDRGFADGGVARLGGQQYFPAVAVSSSGSILVSTAIFNAPEERWTELTELTADGALETGFGSGGIQVVGASTDLSLDSKGGIVLLRRGDEPGHQQLLRLLADGRVDKSFAKNGRRGLRPPGPAILSSVAVDAKGRILVAGVNELKQAPSEPSTAFYAARMLVGQLRANGSLDRGPGSPAWVSTGFGQSQLARAPKGAIDSKGRLVLADPGESPKLPNGGVLLARYGLGS